MKYRLLFVLFLPFANLHAQPSSNLQYKKTSFMIPMRDGVKLNTVILTPLTKETMPLLITRTPYGAGFEKVLDNSILHLTPEFRFHHLSNEGYIFVFQDIRGKYKSEGKIVIHQPLIHEKNNTAVDESTDTWDTIDWLVKNVPGNNGKAGITGVSYPGWLALVGSVHPHPALKASSEQACMGDLFLGDDFHHNGAFRLSYGMEYTYDVEHDGTTDSDFPFTQFDLFDWYLHLGSLKNVNEKYFHGSIPTWNHFVEHPNYDSFWQKNSPLNYVSSPEVPQLHVGGYFDQEDINGPQLMYAHMEKKDSFNRNHIVLGPWFHGQWSWGKGDSIAKISFNSMTGEWFRDLEKKWFDYWLKGIGDGKFEEAYAFQTGSNQWKTYDHWPPKDAVVRNLYAGPDQKAVFERPTSAEGSVSFVSDPAKPVPYRMLPIEATYGKGSRWHPWHVEDQRFVYTRPDVISFSTDTLTEDLIVTGTIKAHLFASTTGTDADWIVKLIDVLPAMDSSNLLMSSYQFPIAMEAFRGRFRNSFSNPQPITPNHPEEYVIGLHQINHVFKKGHRIMIQVQSSWFPVIDRNPQKYIPNIFEAKESDYTKATHTIFFSSKFPTHIELPVMRE
ncbi:MAG: X-Pro dipeptidyl-peptidase [Bacteroidetes bacterium]|nr:MAG: X-Pro dipeptidyl-peptidase [Bacteroidota bacterium]